MGAATGILKDRVDRLDVDWLPVVQIEADPRLVRFVAVMSSITDTSGSPGPGLPLTAVEADDVVGGCRLLSSLSRDAPDLVAGPLDRKRQRWIVTGGGDQPLETWFTPAGPAAAAALSKPSTKPFGLGMFTSTATRQGPSVWRTYLDLNRGSSLHPLPWRTWDVAAHDSASVFEVNSAARWVELVDAYSCLHGGLVYPDWHLISRDFDAVHVTLRSVVAVQGLNFEARRGLTAPAYWDVESTLWLRWCFGVPRMSDEVR